MASCECVGEDGGRLKKVPMIGNPCAAALHTYISTSRAELFFALTRGVSSSKFLNRAFYRSRLCAISRRVVTMRNV